MATTWILVADRARARLFSSATPDAALAEIECFDNPDADTRDVTSHRPPTVNESVGPARHSIEPHTTLREKVTDRFAKSLTDTLERGRVDHRFDRLVLVAPARFLGALHDNLDKPLRDRVTGEVRKNLTTLAADEIRQRLPAGTLQ
jgi:protein required for attachment to host cells